MGTPMEDLERAARLRVCWRVLGGLLQGPIEATTLRTVREEDMLGTWPLPDGQRTDAGLGLWRQSRRTDETAERVEADRRRLVVGPGHVPASPYESVHLGRDALLFEDETMQVREFYRRFGVRVPRLNKDPDDHVCMELEFLAILLGRACDAADRGEVDDARGLLEAHDSFLNDHAGRWFPRFFGLMEEHAASAFMRGLGVLGQDVCAQAV